MPQDNPSSCYMYMYKISLVKKEPLLYISNISRNTNYFTSSVHTQGKYTHVHQPVPLLEALPHWSPSSPAPDERHRDSGPGSEVKGETNTIMGESCMYLSYGR